MKANWLFLLTFALMFYCIGAAIVEDSVNYPTWHLIGANEFKAYHQALGSLIIRFMVIPMVVTFIFTILLLWIRPAAIPRWAVLTAIGLWLMVAILTITVQIPIQMQLSSEGLSPALINKLITTNWMRKIPGLANGLLFLWMMSLVMRGKQSSEK